MAGWGKFDFSVFEQFGADLKAMERAFPRFMLDCLRELANELLKKVVPETPAHNGGLRKGWTIGEIHFTASGAEVEVLNIEEYSFYVENGFASHWVPGRWVGNTFYYIPNYKPATKGEPGGMYVGPKDGWVEGKFMLLTSSELLERELPAIMEKRMKRFISRFLR